MEAVLLNDTRSAEHVGCSLVVANLLRQCERVGMKVVRTITTREAAKATSALREVPDYEILLVNGEGTMHHDRPVALEICRAVRAAKEAGKKTVLLNSVWEENDELVRYLEHFDWIACRDSRSAAAISRHGHPVDVVPDLIFDSRLAASHDPPAEAWGLVVIDSIRRQASRELLDLALSRRAPFLAMDRTGLERLRRRRIARWRLAARTGVPPGPWQVEGFVQMLRGCAACVSGRFHGTCLCLLLGKPVVSVSSNTRKLEGLCADAGLPSEAVVESLDAAVVRDLERRFHVLRGQRARTSRYVADAPARISEMFDRIASLR